MSLTLFFSTSLDTETRDALVCLYVLVSVADALVRHCLQSSLILLTSLIDQYQLQSSGTGCSVFCFLLHITDVKICRYRSVFDIHARNTLAYQPISLRIHVQNVSGALKKLYNVLLRDHATHQQKRVLHPKIVELCRRLPACIAGDEPAERHVKHMHFFRTYPIEKPFA